MIEKTRAKLLGIIFCSIVSIDIISKWLVHSFIPMMQRHILPFPYGGLGVFEKFMGMSFSITHQTNTGAAWGLFPDSQKTLMIVRLIVIAALAAYLVFFNQNYKSQIPFVFIISGAFGNILDSMFYGHVVDMFFWQFGSYDFPVFNVADAFIFLGVAWLCIINLKKEGASKANSQPADDSRPFDSSPFS